MHEDVVDREDISISAEFAYAVATGQAYREAVSRVSQLYVIDEAVRAKLIGLVVKIARNRDRSGHHMFDRGDVEAIAVLAVETFLCLRSGALNGKASARNVGKNIRRDRSV